MQPEQVHNFKDKRVCVDKSWLDDGSLMSESVIKSYSTSVPDEVRLNPLQSTGFHLLLQFAEWLGCHQTSFSSPRTAPIMSKCLSHLLEKPKVEQQLLVSNVVRLVLVFALQKQLLH